MGQKPDTPNPDSKPELDDKTAKRLEEGLAAFHNDSFDEWFDKTFPAEDKSKQ